MCNNSNQHVTGNAINTTRRMKDLASKEISIKYGIIMTYYYGFLFTIIVNSAIWYVISYLVSKYYYKYKGIIDQKYLIQYALNKIKKK